VHYRYKQRLFSTLKDPTVHRTIRFFTPVLLTTLLSISTHSSCKPALPRLATFAAGFVTGVAASPLFERLKQQESYPPISPEREKTLQETRDAYLRTAH